MAVYKCKMCGGSMEIQEDSKVAICEYCGTKQTLPKLDTEKKAALYDRAGHFRRNNDYDKAMSLYEQIVSEDREDAEAYWSLVLCRYGIEYVEDPETHKRVPTVNRAQLTSVFADEDYRSAIRYADAVQKSVYEEEAKAIDDIQKGILAISQKEKPFDVFICYKETDADGRRTRDSVLATELYQGLVKEGLKVFFSRITLEDKLGTAYEPYIFAALHSAKVMVVLGTKPEYFNAVWVKNEWSRYLALMKNDSKKMLIPAYRDMDPYDLPEEFSYLQAQDMAKLGFMQDLIRGIRKIVGTRPVPNVEKETVFTENKGNIQSLLKRGYMALEDSDWEKAYHFFDEALDIHAECAEAYMGQKLAEDEMPTVEDWIAARVKRVKEENPEKTFVTLPNTDDSALKEKYTSNNLISTTEWNSKFVFRNYYYSIVSAYQNALETEEKEWEEDKLLSKAIRFSTDGSMQKIRNTILSEYQKYIDVEKQQDIQNQEKVLQQYRDEHQNAIAYFEKLYNERAEEKYTEFCSEQEDADTTKMCNWLGNMFLALRDYKDSAERAAVCFAKEKKIRAENIAKDKKISKIKNIVIWTSIAAILCTCLIIILSQRVLIPAGHYKDGQKLMNQGAYDEAIDAFESAGGYRDAEEKILEIQNVIIPQMHYLNGDALLAIGEHEKAIEEYKLAGDFLDAPTKIKSVYYEQAEANLQLENYQKALEYYQKAGKYLDADEKMTKLRYILAGYNKIAAGDVHIAVLSNDGTVKSKFLPDNNYGEYRDNQWNTEGWKNIISISAGRYHTVGLCENGTAVATPVDHIHDHGQSNVSLWQNLIAIAAGNHHTVGLRKYGWVVANGSNSYGQCNVSMWKDVVAIAAGGEHTVAVFSSGEVAATGKNDWGQCDVSSWEDIYRVSAGEAHTVGLKKDGTVVAVGDNSKGQRNVGWWTDITEVAAGGAHTVGLRKDGTVVAVGDNSYGQCDVLSWNHMVAITAGKKCTLGLCEDGTVLIAGCNL